MTQVRATYRWKTADLDRLPDTPWLRYEIIDGELIVSRRPHLQHSEIIVILVSLLHPAVRALGGKVLAEPGIVWGEEAEDNVVPDIAVVLPDRLHLNQRPRVMDTATRSMVRQHAGNRCEYCGILQEQMSAAAFHVDHIIPKQHGGSDDPSHLALVGTRQVSTDVVWAKLQALVEGARLASTRLWG